MLSPQTEQICLVSAPFCDDFVDVLRRLINCRFIMYFHYWYSSPGMRMHPCILRHTPVIHSVNLLRLNCRFIYCNLASFFQVWLVNFSHSTFSAKPCSQKILTSPKSETQITPMDVNRTVERQVCDVALISVGSKLTEGSPYSNRRNHQHTHGPIIVQ